jgi:hypothetical protein
MQADAPCGSTDAGRGGTDAAAGHTDPAKENNDGGARLVRPPEDWFVLLERVTAEIAVLLDNRRTWQNLQARAAALDPQAAAGPEGGWLAELYYRDAALGIRRMVDGDHRTGSFKRLLQKLAEDPRLVAEEWFLGCSSGARREELAAAFREHADTQRFGHLNPAVPRADLAALSDRTAGIKCWVDQHITHAQLDPHSTQPPPSDIDAALDLLAALLEKYTLLLRPVGQADAPDADGPSVPGPRADGA